MLLDSLYLYDRILELDRTPTLTVTENRNVWEWELPGFQESEVEVKVSKNKLVIKAKSSKKEKNFVYRLPNSVDPESTTAKLKYGVLTVTFGQAPATEEKTLKL